MTEEEQAQPYVFGVTVAEAAHILKLTAQVLFDVTANDDDARLPRP